MRRWEEFTMWMTNAPRALDLSVTGTYEWVTDRVRVVVVPTELAAQQAQVYGRARKVMVRVDG